MSYLELAKRSLNRASGEMSPVESVLAAGERLTLEEVAAESGVEIERVRRELGSLVERGEAYTAVDLRRRAEVFWSRFPE